MCTQLKQNTSSWTAQLFFKMGQTRPLFRLFSVFFKQTIQFLQQINVKNVMSIQYPVPGFEPTTGLPNLLSGPILLLKSFY